MADVGNFPLDSVAALPNVSVAFPGEHWSDGKASEAIVPGCAIIPISSAGKRYWRIASAAAEATDPRAAIALWTVQPPDSASDSIFTSSLGPNEIVNRTIPVGEWVHAYYSGEFHLTLFTPAAYAPADLIGWDPAGARPTGKGGTGAWAKTAVPANAAFEVIEFRPLANAPTEGVLTVRRLGRTQN